MSVTLSRRFNLTLRSVCLCIIIHKDHHLLNSAEHDAQISSQLQGKAMHAKHSLSPCANTRAFLCQVEVCSWIECKSIVGQKHLATQQRLLEMVQCTLEPPFHITPSYNNRMKNIMQMRFTSRIKHQAQKGTSFSYCMTAVLVNNIQQANNNNNNYMHIIKVFLFYRYSDSSVWIISSYFSISFNLYWRRDQRHHLTCYKKIMYACARLCFLK